MGKQIYGAQTTHSLPACLREDGELQILLGTRRTVSNELLFLLSQLLSLKDEASRENPRIDSCSSKGLRAQGLTSSPLGNYSILTTERGSRAKPETIPASSGDERDR
jgi:hypothetical protein